MSTGTKRPLAEALKDAEAFRDLFDGFYARWEIAGSVRRKKPEVSDIEHVVIPCDGFMRKMNELTAMDTGLFGGHSGPITRHVYKVHKADGSIVDQHRWGEKYKGCDFRGFNHEVFCADHDNFGAILAIRTGPAEFSEHLVTVIQSRGLRQSGGYVVYQRSGERYKVPTEQAFFEACGVAYIEPEQRQFPASTEGR